MEDNHHLRLRLLSQAEQLNAAEAQLARQQSELVDRIVVEQIDARNRALLHEVSRLVTENTDLKQQQLMQEDTIEDIAAAAATSPAKRSSLIVVPDLLTVLPAVQHQDQQQQVEVSPMSPKAAAAAAAAVAAANAHISSNSSRLTIRQQSLSRLASSSSRAPVTRASGLSAVAAAALAAADLDAEQSSRKPISFGGRGLI